MTHPRNLIVAEEDSQATVVEDYVSLGGGAAFCNTVTELVAGDNAVVSHYMIEREDTQSFQHLHAAHPAGEQRQRRLALACCWAARWCATTCIRCWPAKAASA